MDSSTWLELALAYPAEGATAQSARRRERLGKEPIFPGLGNKEAWDRLADNGKILAECLPLWFATGLVDVDYAIERECPPADLSQEQALLGLCEKLNVCFMDRPAYFSFVKVPLEKPSAGQSVRYRLERRTTLVPPSKERFDIELLEATLLEDALEAMSNVGMIYRACGYCGRIFKGERSTATYCSTSCRTLALRKKKIRKRENEGSNLRPFFKR